MNNNFFDVLAKLDQIEKSVTESAEKDHDMDEGNLFTGNLKKAREQGKDKADLDGDGDLEKVQKEGVFKSPRDMPAKDLVKVPAIQRPNRRLNLQDLGIGKPEYFGPNPDTGANPVDVPAYIRKAKGENFPASPDKPQPANPAKLGESQQLDECGMTDGSMSPMPGGMEQENQGRLNISSNYDSESGRKSLTVTAEGDQAEELAQMLKLSGMMGGTGMDSEHPRSMKIVGSMDAEGADDLAKMLRHSGLQEAYANEPDEKVETTEKILDQGNDLNRKKKQHADKPKLGDNPLATEEKDKSVTESLEQRLWAEFQREKAR